MADETKVVVTAVSPTPVKSPEGVKQEMVDFFTAVRRAMEGKRITKLEWKNEKIFGLLSKETYHLTLHKEDGQEYDWIISEGDLTGKDWIVL